MFFNQEALRKILVEYIEGRTLEEQIDSCYVLFRKVLPELDRLHFPQEVVTMAIGLIYFQRKSRMDGPFPIPLTHELRAIFRDLEQDEESQKILSWLAKNFDRFSLFSRESPETYQSLLVLMQAGGVAYQDRGPLILRTVIDVVLREYTARGYDAETMALVLRKNFSDSAMNL